MDFEIGELVEVVGPFEESQQIKLH